MDNKRSGSLPIIQHRGPQMPRLISIIVAGLLTMILVSKTEAADKQPAALDFTMMNLSGKKVDLSTYLGKVVLIVNTASECGLTPQYEQLQALHNKYGEKGLAILGFPCNQFGKQEPGNAKTIQAFCTKNYGVKFDVFAKVEVNGDGACDLYKYLTARKTKPKGAGNVRWNFEKFLLNRQGEVIARFGPRTSPDDKSIVGPIEAELAKKPQLTTESRKADISRTSVPVTESKKSKPVEE